MVRWLDGLMIDGFYVLFDHTLAFGSHLTGACVCLLGWIDSFPSILQYLGSLVCREKI